MLDFANDAMSWLLSCDTDKLCFIINSSMDISTSEILALLTSKVVDDEPLVLMLGFKILCSKDDNDLSSCSLMRSCIAGLSRSPYVGEVRTADSNRVMRDRIIFASVLIIFTSKPWSSATTKLPIIL